MYFPASEELLAKYSTREEDVRNVDAFLHQHGGEVFYVREAAYMLDLAGPSLKRLLAHYEQTNVIRRVERGTCCLCGHFAELIGDHEEQHWQCDDCGLELKTYEIQPVECYSITPSNKPKISHKEEKKMKTLQLLTHGRTQPWSWLDENKYLRLCTHIGHAEEQFVLESLQMYGIALLRQQGQTPSRFQLEAIEDFLGPAMALQNAVPGKIKSITPTEAFKANTGDSALALPFHTDGTQEPDLPPAILIFQYETTPSFGGQSTFLDLTQVFQELSEEERERILVGLAYPDAAVCQKLKGDTVLHYEGPLVKPVCADQALAFRLRFDEPTITVAARSGPGFVELRDKIVARGNVLKYKPQEGDIVIFDNWRVMHGRASVQGGRHPRLHNRMWIKDLEDRHQGKYILGVRGIEAELIMKVKQANNGN